MDVNVRFNKRTATVAAACICVPIIVAAVAIASSTSDSPGPSAASDGTTDFYTESQIDGAWLAVTSDFSEPLPRGFGFPQTTPEIFQPEEGAETRWEVGMVYSVAARYWRCAWLDEKLAADLEGDSNLADEAATMLSRYAELPHVDEAYVDGGVDGYLEELRKGAESQNLTTYEFEYQIECLPLDGTVLEIDRI